MKESNLQHSCESPAAAIEDNHIGNVYPDLVPTKHVAKSYTVSSTAIYLHGFWSLVTFELGLHLTN